MSANVSQVPDAAEAGTASGPAAPALARLAPPAADAGPLLITNPRFRAPPAPPAYPSLAREQGQEGEAFEPGRRGGEPVVAWVQIPVRFALR